MQKYYFELDKVQAITINFERETSYKWYDYMPKQVKKFLGFTYDIIPAKEAGYSDNDSEHATRNQTEYFNQYNWYRVDETNKKIYNKASVYISLGYKQSYSAMFESNEEAQAYVDDLITSSDKKFHVIINK